MTRIKTLLKTMDEHYDEQGEMYDPEKDIREFLSERDSSVIGQNLDFTNSIGMSDENRRIVNGVKELQRRRAKSFDSEEAA